MAASQHFRTYPICAWSGELGPKVQQGDGPAPEGFYTVSRAQMNPHSLYHLALDISFPNTYDQVNGHSGSALIGARQLQVRRMLRHDRRVYRRNLSFWPAKRSTPGRPSFHVQALPFRMSTFKMILRRGDPWYPFWSRLKEGYDAFEGTGKPPIVKVCGKQYTSSMSLYLVGDPAPDAPCPHLCENQSLSNAQHGSHPQTVLASLNKGDTPSRQPTQAPALIAVVERRRKRPRSNPLPTCWGDGGHIRLAGYHAVQPRRANWQAFSP